ncbi:MAG: sulfatase-like hydrolase/transferase [bacterium]|nr:sulfatase-like hydrolase/transferase [bacterium]
MSSGKQRLAAALVLVALAVNPWLARALLDRFFSLGEMASRPSVFWNILTFQLVVFFLAVLLIRRRAAIQIAFVAAFISFACLTTFDAIRFLDIMRRPSGPSPAQILLTAAEGFEARKFAALDDETGEILYSLHEGSHRRSFRVPKSAILETARGMDSHVTHLFKGKVHFEISLDTGSDPPRRLFFDEIDLSSAAPGTFSWHPVTLDLSAHAGEEITLAFSKGFSPTPERQPLDVYELLPIDFMFWREPQLRPRHLDDQPNVVLISLDTVRGDHLQFMGYRRETSPHIDRLADRGTVFTTAVSQAPWTTPSHFSIFTATYPSVHQGNQSGEVTTRYWDDRLPTMASMLRERGYLTAAFTGKGQISAKFGFFKGFDFYNETARDQTGSDVGPILEKSVRWLRENRDRSFFLFLHTYEPHVPYRDDHFVTREGIDPGDTVAYRTARYDGNLRRTDVLVGGFVDELERLGLLADTIVVLTSDHGEDLTGRYPLDPGPQHGHTLYDELLLVPLIFHAPGRIPEGERIDHQVRLIDILPTILDYLELDSEALSQSIQGQSLRAMIEGRDATPRPAYSEATTYGTERESLRTAGYKYIHRLSYGTLASSQHFRDLPLSPSEELYDLKTDPGETVDLAQSRPELLRKLREKLLAMFPERGDDYFEKAASQRPSYKIDISRDEELMESLRRLGYIQ